VKMLEKMTLVEVPPERKRVHFTFPSSAKSGRTVLELKDVRKAYGPVTVLNNVNLHIERGDRIALVGANGAGKSTLMRMLAAVEPPDAGIRIEGPQVVMQYFAQDEATRLDGTLTVYETLSAGSPLNMVPGIRNILGGFLFEGDDIYKRVQVLSGGERTRLAVARMLLHPSNTLLLDEPTNHLDIDSTNVLLDALVDYGGTLIFVSHDRYFVDRLATKVLEVGDGAAVLYPGTYEEFRWSLERRHQPPSRRKTSRPAPSPRKETRSASAHRKLQVQTRRQERRLRTLHARIAELEARIGEREQRVRAIEQQMTDPDFYTDEGQAKSAIGTHQTLMWEVGDLMNQWEALHKEAEELSQAVQKDVT
jgi:ATP-binding cassette subfamily F protein 3